MTHVPGLVVVEALAHTPLECGWAWRNVEVFVYEGNGQLIITTGAQVRAATGLMPHAQRQMIGRGGRWPV